MLRDENSDREPKTLRQSPRSSPAHLACPKRRRCQGTGGLLDVPCWLWWQQPTSAHLSGGKRDPRLAHLWQSTDVLLKLDAPSTLQFIHRVQGKAVSIFQQVGAIDTDLGKEGRGVPSRNGTGILSGGATTPYCSPRNVAAVEGFWHLNQCSPTTVFERKET